MIVFKRRLLAWLLLVTSLSALTVTLLLWRQGVWIEEVTLVKGGIVANETRGYKVVFDRVRNVEYNVLLLEASGNPDISIVVLYNINNSMGGVASSSIRLGARGYISLPRGALIETFNLRLSNPPLLIPPSLLESIEPGVLRVSYEMPGLGLRAVISYRLVVEWFNLTVLRGNDVYTLRVELYDGFNMVKSRELECRGYCNLEMSLDETITSIDVKAIEVKGNVKLGLTLLAILSTILLLASTYTLFRMYSVRFLRNSS